MEISKDDYLSWRNHPISQLFLEDSLTTIDGQIAALLHSAGDNPLQDKYRIGLINGLRALADWQPDLIEERQDVDSEGA